MDIAILRHQMTILRPPMATNKFWRLRYEEEHDPWNAHLRSEHSASSSGTAVYVSRTGAQTYSAHSWSQGILGDAPTTTRLTDAMTYRYSQVEVQNSEQRRPQPDHDTEGTMTRSLAESDFCDCSCTCKLLRQHMLLTKERPHCSSLLDT